MSWIVASLLNDRERIKSEGDLDSDDFNDLLLIEKAIETLAREKRLSKDELIIIGFLHGTVEMERHVIAKKRQQICQRIGYYLGDYFTDEGYLDYMQIKHNLTDEQVETLRKYINSKYKHKVARKPIPNE